MTSKYKNILFYSIVLILLGTNIFLAINLKNSKLDESKDFPYIDFSRNFIDQKNYIVNIQPLREKLKTLAQEYGEERVSIYIEFLNTGANISINPETYIFPASLLKLPISMVAMKKVENGDWKLTNELVLLEEDKNKRSGDEDNLLANETTGTRFTIEKLIQEALINSDNTAYNILIRNLGDKEIDALISSLGLDKLLDSEGKVSAKEYSRLLRSLYTASYLDRYYSQKILTYMDESNFNEFLASTINKEIPFPHKYGENLKQNVFSDSGIVYIEDRPYLISVIIQGEGKNGATEKDIEKAKNFMREVSKETYEYFVNYE